MAFRAKRWFFIVAATSMLYVGGLAADEPRLDISKLGLHRPSVATVNVLPPCPRDLTINLTKAEEAIANDEFAEALELIEKVRADAEDKDYFIGNPTEGGTHRGLQAELERLVLILAEKNTALVETRWGSQANNALKQATEQRDLDALETVARRYLGVDAGRKAAILFARLSLDGGRPALAATWLRAVRRYADARKYEPELTLLQAASLYSSGASEDEVNRVLQQLPTLANGQAIELGGAAEPLFRGSQTPSQWLAQYLPDGLNAPQLKGWTTVRGAQDRNGGVSDASYGDVMAWRVPMVEDPERRELMMELDAYYRERGQTVWPTTSPLVVGNVVVARTLDRIYGVDPQTGKRLWWYPHSPFKSELDEELDDLSWSRKAHQLVWRDSMFGRLSSDGENVYCLSVSDSNDPLESLQQNPFAIRATRGVTLQTGSNQLIGLSVAAQGKLLFLAGGKNTTDPELEGLFFLGPPLAVRGVLYCLAEKNGDVRLLALDSHSGKMSWWMTLANVSNSHLRQDPQRRLSGLTPTFHGGVLLCPTSAGVITAVDISRRSLLWAYQYPVPAQTAMSSQQRAMIIMQVNGGVPADMSGERDEWKDSSLLVSDRRVLATPIFSEELYCLDLDTGDLIWSKPRKDMSYIGCIHQDVVFLVGQYRVTGLRLQDGEPAWPESNYVAFPSGGAPSGLGFRSGGHYVVPLTDNELAEFDIPTGVIVQRTKLTAAPGNLAPWKDGLISQSPLELQLFTRPVGPN